MATPSSSLAPSASSSSTGGVAYKPCQRSCRGLLVFVAPVPASSTTSKGKGVSSPEPICLGLSSAHTGEPLNLEKVHAQRAVPEGQRLSFQLALGHIVHQPASSESDKVVPPGCEYGIEFMRFSRIPAAADTAPSGDAASQPPQQASPASALPVPSLLADLTASITSAASSLRVSSSNADINKQFHSLTNFDANAFWSKWEAQANKNVGHMRKWLQDLRNAVTKEPKA